jgi:type IV pilus assembly protein PilP
MIRQWVVVLGLIFLLTGCKTESEIDRYIDKVKETPAQSVEALPDMTLPIPSEYRAKNESDPFYRPSRDGSILVQEQARPEIDRPKEILESLSLDSLRMVGTLEQRHQRWAIIEDKTGLIYRVAKGDHMGKDFGKITEISEDTITLVELIPDNISGWRERITRLVMDAA